MKSDKLNTAVHAAVVACLALSAMAVRTAHAADAASTNADVADTKKNKEEALQEVVVTGSLIPQVVKETSQPLTTITAEDIQQKGFASVTEALQHSSFATGSVQGQGTSLSFTQGLQTLSLFGLNPGYTKFLIDGRPIADYPALYNGTDIVTSISGIPEIALDHVDVLPGAQSSIYGSDAIAGVVNLNLIKKLDGPVADARYGWTKDGGGNSTRFGLADGFNFGIVNIVAAGQYEKIDPIWGYQRPLTAQVNQNGTSPAIAERTYLVFGAFSGQYDFQDPANCANVAGQYGNTVGLQTRAGRGQYCGTFRDSIFTLANAQENTEGYLHATADVTSHMQIFGDVLVSHDVTRYFAQSNFLSTADDPRGPYYYFYDPNLNDLVNIQHIFSPEEENSTQHMTKNTSNSIRATLGVTGDFGGSWKYDVDWTYTQSKLTEAFNIALESKINNYFSAIMGPQQGVDPFYNTYGVYTPNYAAFYQPLTPDEYASFTTWAKSYSQTEDSTVRGQITNSDLFTLPGGNAGMALLVEGGDQGWHYNPDPAFTDGQAYLITSVGGDGHRSRYAGTGEFRAPVLKQVTIDLSGRYDDYRVDGNNVDKFTYNIGLEYRPVESFLVRGRYGTAFKVPTLSDEFQGQSGFFEGATDYYKCEQQGFTLANGTLPNCRQYIGNAFQVFGTTAGNPLLHPITAKVWDAGLVWSPTRRSSFSVDYMHWDIDNEVVEQSVDQLLLTENDCHQGQLDPTSPTCEAAFAQVTRDALGNITQVTTPKLNLAEERLDVLAVSANYAWESRVGVYTLQGAWSDILKHDQTQFPGDPSMNLFQNPFFSTEFKTKGNVSVDWQYAKFGATAYFEWYGKSPNNLANLTNSYDPASGGGKLGSWEIMNLSARYEVIKGLTVTGNVNNVFNRMPPMDFTYDGNTNAPYNTQNYNALGRSYFVTANYKFGK